MEYTEREIDIKEYFWVLYKHRWAIMSFFVAIVSLALAYNLLVRPDYRATTRVLIEKESQTIVDFKDIYSIDATSKEFYQTQYKILESRFIARKVIDNLNLWENVELAGKRDPEKREGLSQDEIKSMEIARQENIISNLLRNLSVQPVRNTQIVIVTFTSKSSGLAARVANNIVNSYIEYSLATRLNANIGASGFLRKQIAEHRVALEESEKLLQSYKEEYKIISLEEENKITMQNLAALSSDLLQAESKRIEAQSKYTVSIEMVENFDNARSIPEVMRNSFITRLKTDEATLLESLSAISMKYGSKHPQVIYLNEKIKTVRGKIQDEILQVVDSLKSEYDIALRNEIALNNELSKLKEESQKLGKHAISYNVIAREVQTNKQLYEVLLKRLKETSITGGIQTTNVRVLDKAIPPSNSFRPRKMLNILLAILFSSFMGPVIAMALEYLDNSIKSQDDIERYLKVPFLGPLPEIQSKAAGNGQDRKSMLVTSIDPKSVTAEAFRSARTSIIFSSPDERKTLLVTSTSPSEGKSVTSSNLAVTMAQNGSRTLIVDMDFRRPVLHKIFNVPQEKGFSNVLVGDAELDEVIVNTRISNLDIIASGHIPPNPAELLSSEGVSKYMDILKEKYDKIIVDSPPIMSATDPVIIGTFIDEVLLVIKAGETSRDLALTAIRKMQHVKANLIGTVLNSVIAGQGQYYYQQYHYYGEEAAANKSGLRDRLKGLSIGRK